MADDPKCPIEFDANLNEYHIMRRDGDGYSMIYYCPFCSGAAPKSKRSLLFHRITDEERKRLSELTKDIRTIQELTTAFGEPAIKQEIGATITMPELGDQAETTRSYPVVIYTGKSKIADIHAMIYPTDRVQISFRGKSAKKVQT